VSCTVVLSMIATTNGLDLCLRFLLRTGAVGNTS
ncbi:uncharacterized protein METZ01_LOCUS259370, partial [marine metagenome]